MRIILYTFLVVAYLPFNLYSQFLSGSSIGAQFGLSQSGTDTHTWGNKEEGIFSEAHLLYGINFSNKISNSISASISFTKTRISGDDLNIEALKVRGWQFSSPLTEFSLNVNWNFLATSRNKKIKIFDAEGKSLKFSKAALFRDTYFNHNGELIEPSKFKNQKYTFDPYFLIGINSSHIDPTVNFRNTPPQSDLLASDLSKQKSNYFHLSLGAGIKIHLTERISIDTEVKGIIPQTDLLDGISRTILEFNSERNKDSYQFALLRINYTLSPSKNCDSDELIDKYDKCPCENGSLNLWGCPDSDLDGIVDIKDTCPLEKGSIKLDGCPDKDKDGIADHLDDCPGTFGLYIFNGCPDRDADGIPDKRDKCPDQPGSKSNNGCPK